MKPFLIISIICSIQLGFESKAQVPDTIPFQLTAQNNIAVKALINEQDSVTLMFHTAANDVSIIEAAEDKTSSIKWTQSTEVESWGGGGESKVSKGNSLQIGDLKWNELLIWQNQHSGPETDGKFGPHLFENKPIEINYVEGILIVHHKLPSYIEEYIELPLTSENGLLFVTGACIINDQRIEHPFLIHSGYAGEVLFDDQFASQHQMNEYVEITDEQILKDSFGNELKTKQGTISTFYIGDIGLKDVDVSFFEGQIGRQKISVIGGGLMRKMNWIINADRTKVYVKTIG